VTCPESVVRCLRDYPVDYFLEIGGYTGECAAIAGYWKLAKKGVIELDASVPAIKAFNETVARVFRGGFGRTDGTTSVKLNNNEADKTESHSVSDYLIVSDAVFVGAKPGYFRQRNGDFDGESGENSYDNVPSSNDQQYGPNSYQGAKWEECEDDTNSALSLTSTSLRGKSEGHNSNTTFIPTVTGPRNIGSADSNRSPCVRFTTVDEYLSGLGLFANNNTTRNTVNTPSNTVATSTVGLRVKVSSDEDDILIGMRESLRLKRLLWVEFHVTKWCSIAKKKDCYSEALEFFGSYGYGVLSDHEHAEPRFSKHVPHTILFHVK
jgi:hypothetical protein